MGAFGQYIIKTYNHLHEHLQNTDHYYKQMLLQIAGKQAGYRAMAEYYQSLVCKNNKSIGEEIARLEVVAIK